MSTNLLSLVQTTLGGDFSRLAGQFLGESGEATSSAVSALLPAVLGTVSRKGATTDGAASLMSLINNSGLDASQLGNLAGLFGGGGAGISNLMRVGSGTLVPALFGDKSGALVNALSSAAGIKSGAATNLIAMVVGIVMMVLKKLIGERGLNASSLSALLSAQGPNLQSHIDGRLSSALGFGNPAAFLSGLGQQAGDAALRAGSAVAAGTAATATAAKSGFMRWLPWVIGLLLLLWLWNMFSGPTTPPPAPTKAPVAVPPPAPAPAAVPAVAGFPAKVYFEVGSASIGADGGKTVAAAAEQIRKDSVKVAVTGFTDRTGDAAKNEELAKERAKAVRDALVAAGVPEASIEMRPPMFVETGAAGSDAEARRVDISRM